MWPPTEMLLSRIMCSLEPNLTTWLKLRQTVQDIKAAARPSETLSNVQQDPGRPVWNKPGPKERRKLVLETL